MNLLSAFAGGLWIIPVVLVIAAVISFSLGYRASKSNSTQQPGGGLPTRDNTGNVSITKTGQFWFGIIFLVVAVIIIWYMYSER